MCPIILANRIKPAPTFDFTLTLVIAGMIQEHETKTVSKVPVLGDIPVIGTVFRNTISGKTKSEMMILLTPKIITDNDDAVGNTDTL